MSRTLKPPPAWIIALIPNWREKLGGWTKASAPSCNRAARGEEAGSSDKWTLAVVEALGVTDERPVYRVPNDSTSWGISPRELAAYYPPSDLWGYAEVWATLAYFQGAVANPDRDMLRWSVQKIAGHVTTAILLAAPHVTHRHLIQMDPRATMSDNLRLVDESIDKGTAMTPHEMAAWTQSPQLYVGLNISNHGPRLPLPSGWWSNGGEPLHHPYEY